MKDKRQSILIVFLLVATVSFGSWLSQLVNAKSPDYYQKIRKNLNVFGTIYKEITKDYVEEIDPEKFIQAGIRGMLNTLDPYTVYVKREEGEELQIMTSGKYGGLGMVIGMRDGVPTVVDPPFEGTPALKAGIREGDKIIEVDGVSTKNLSISQTASRLRGEPGTMVNVKILREGEPEPLEFHIVRAIISIKDVIYSGFIEDGMGYIKLSRFSRNAGKEVGEAISKLKADGLQALILDLRFNPGGLLESAVEVVDKFIKKGQLIVYTKGRTENSNKEYRAQEDPILDDLPLVVLVNHSSASASEIVAGAVQDLDRGLVVGDSTYGKGLVQSIVPLSRNASLKITTAKYYIPSGRCIQRPDVFHEAEESVFFQNQNQQKGKPTKKENDQFKTAAGRIVYGGGGIIPDITVEEPKLSQFEIELLRKSMFFNFAVSYVATHRNLPKDFCVDSAMVAEFKEYLEKKHFDYQIEGQKELAKLKSIVQEKNYNSRVVNHIDEIDAALNSYKEKDFANSLDFIKQQLQREIAAKLWGTKAEIKSTFNDDTVLQKAVEVLSSPQQYAALLGKH